MGLELSKVEAELGMGDEVEVSTSEFASFLK